MTTPNGEIPTGNTNQLQPPPDEAKPPSESAEFLRETALGLLAKKVTQSMATLPPNVPEYGKSNEFWDTVDILKQPDVTYGDIRVVPAAADERAIRRAFVRTMSDQSGVQIGTWTKHGFISPDGQRLVNFSEEVSYSPQGRRAETVLVVPSSDNKVNTIIKKTTQDYQTTSDIQLRYRYNEDGSLNMTTYTENDAQRNEVFKKDRYIDNWKPPVSTAPETQTKTDSGPPTPRVSSAREAPTPPAGGLKGFANKLLGRKLNGSNQR